MHIEVTKVTTHRSYSYPPTESWWLMRMVRYNNSSLTQL